MYRDPSYQIGSDSSEEAPKSLNQISQKLKSLQIWRKQKAILKEKDKIERETQLTILEEELGILKQKDERCKRRLEVGDTQGAPKLKLITH